MSGIRKAHKLEVNKTKMAPRYCVFMDSESRVDEETYEHTPYLICAAFKDARYEKETWKDYVGNTKQFWADAAKYGGNGKSVYIFGHNIGYDVIATEGIPVLVDLGYQVSSFFDKGLTFILQATKYADKKKPDGTVEKRRLKTLNLISSTNYYPQSLASLGEIFGLEKLDFEYNTGSIEDAITYCRRDVEICKKSMEHFMSFVDAEDLGVFAKTTPGQAFNAFRHRFMGAEIWLHDKAEAIQVERQAYSGGRVECWKLGTYTSETDFYGYDINSMYPYVMKEFEYPTRLLTYREKPEIEEIKSFIDQGAAVIARCLVKTDKPYVGAKIGDSFIFPTGEFWAYLSTPEISFLLARGMVLEVSECTLYQTENLFERYVEYFYGKKVQSKEISDVIHEKLYKMFLNALYGKFGQLSEDFVRVGDAGPAEIKYETVFDADLQKEVTYKIFGGSVFMSTEQTEAFNAFCAIAAHVTAYARMTLLRYIEIAGWENVLYMDTDSLFVNEAGAQNLERAGVCDPKILGKMKLEKQANTIQINAPKDYTFAGETRRKGVKQNSKQVGDNEWEVIQFPTLNTFIREGQLKQYHNVRRIKKLKHEYSKGWLLSDGTVVPLELVADGDQTLILPWEKTSYYKNGLALKTLDQEELIKKKFKKNFFGV